MIFCWIFSKRLQNCKSTFHCPVCIHPWHTGILFLERTPILTGKTHFTFGTAVTVLITHPSDWKSFLLCLGAGAVGACVSDVDVSTSGSHKGFQRLLLLIAAAVLVVAGLDFFFQAGIWAMIQQKKRVAPQSGRGYNLSGSLSLRRTSAASELYPFSCWCCYAWYSCFYHAPAGSLVFCLWDGDAYFSGFVESKKGAATVSV